MGVDLGPVPATEGDRPQATRPTRDHGRHLLGAVHPCLADIVGDYDGFKGEYLFSAPASNRFPDGQHHLNPRTVNVDFKYLAKQAGLEVGRKKQGLTFHALRRFFKTSCLNAGVPLPLIDRWVGHSNKNDINSHYYRPTRAEEAQQMSAVGFGKTSTP